VDDAADGNDDVARSDIVPLGDFFNHFDPANVVVNYVDDSANENNCSEHDSAVKFVLNQDIAMNENPQLFLSYGLTTNPYRFLVLFGFANDQMKELYSQVLFTKPSKEMIDLGCADRSKMVYRTKDGAVANTIWDTVLYSLLEQQLGNTEVKATREAFYKAHVNGDEATKAAIRARYNLESHLTLRNHVERTLKEFDELVDKVDSIIEASGDKDIVEKEYPRLEMIHKHNKFVQGVFQKVQRKLDDTIKTETTRRRQVMSEAQY
jgi:Fe-S oxidoreductase